MSLNSAVREIEDEVERLERLRAGDFKLIRALAAEIGVKITAPNDKIREQWEQFHAGVVTQNALFRDLFEAAAAVSVDVPRPMENGACHNGITTVEKCGRCSRAANFYNAWEAARNVL